MDFKQFDTACETQREIIYKEMQARIAELERIVVWCLKHDAKHRLNVRRFIDEDNGSRLVWYEAPGWSAKFVEVPAGAEPAGILAALKEAMGDGMS